MKLRRVFIAPAVVALLVLATSQVAAVQYGQPDTNNEYEWVGLMVAYDEDGQPLWRCTGSLIDADTFLTAGHCVGQDTEGNVPATAGIWFDVGPITTDPQYLANLDAGAADLCAASPGTRAAATTPTARPRRTRTGLVPSPSRRRTTWAS